MTSLPEIKAWGIEVPEKSRAFFISQKGNELAYEYFPVRIAIKALPPGSWQLLQPKVVFEYSEDEAKGVGVKKIEAWHYMNYEKAYKYCDTAKESLLSLIEGKYKLNPKTTILITLKQ